MWPTEDVPELRKLVQAPAPQNAAEPRDAGIVVQLEHGLGETVERNEVPEELLGIDDHRAELEHAEWASADPGSHLRKDNRAGAVEFDRGRDDNEAAATGRRATWHRWRRRRSRASRRSSAEEGPAPLVLENR